MNRLLLSSLSAAVFVALAGPAQAVDTSVDTSLDTNTQVKTGDQDVYGYELMTPEERAEFHSKMQSAKTSEERERLRIEHNAAMQARAKQRGITLPDDPGMNQTPDSGAGSGDLR